MPDRPSDVAATPGTDRRWRMVETVMRRHGFRGDALIETLHVVQETYGYLEESALRNVARDLTLPLSKVFGVATFYHIFTLRPPGRHTCVVCLGTACYIKGAAALVQAIEQRFGVKMGGTTGDHALSLAAARCVGSCGLAPAVVLDGDVHGLQSAETLVTRIEERLRNAS